MNHRGVPSLRLLSIAIVVAVAYPSPIVRAQDEKGRIEGRLVRKDGKGVVGASVLLNQIGETHLTGPNGVFSFSDLPLGTYSITWSLGRNLITRSELKVSPGTTTTIEETVDWEEGFTDSLIVRGVSRREERIVEAPAAASLIGEAEIERKASNGQVAKLLEFTPGAQVTQGGLWDFNIGTRGFNRSLSRRVAVLQDGHDLSLPFFGYQGWPAFSFPLDDLASVELVRGPSGALYGANAAGGVISMTSKEPRYSRGGFVRVAFGEQDTVNVESRWAGQLGQGWYGRVVGGVRHSNGFAVSRVSGPEYSVACAAGAFGDCLPAEVVAFDGEDATVVFGGLRLDKYLSSGRLITVEGGHAHGGFGVFQSSGQRAKSATNDGKRPWARVAMRGDRFDVSASYDGYYEPGYLGLTTGTQFNSNSYRLHVEGQTNKSFRQGAVQLVVGAAAGLEKMNSYNRTVGTQTFLTEPVASDTQAVFGQGAWQVSRRMKVMLAARTDWGSLYDVQFSPRAAVTYDIAPNQNVRLTYSRAFQVPNSLEYFLDAPVAPPADLALFNAFCAPFNANCRFGSTPIVAVGNEDLGVEKVQTWEAGYKGVIQRRAFVAVDYYKSRSSNLTTSLLPQLGTPLGRLNPRFGPWQGPSGLPSAIVDQIRTLVPLLSNRADGSNVLVAASYTNFAAVNIQGLDFALNYSLPAGWRVSSSYSLFDFDIQHQPVGTENLLLPNAPDHSFNAGVAYERGRIGASADVRWVGDFRWADGFFLGDVRSYTVVDATMIYPLSASASLTFNVSNLFNDRHWESFGGALLRRRALVGVQYNW